MLKIVNRLNQLKFSELMSVYSEGNVENGAERYPDLSKEAQIREAELDFYSYLNETFFCTEGAYYALWEDDNRYVSALRMEPYNDGWLLCALETKPSERRKGHAANLINAVLDYMAMPAETTIYSHVWKGNKASVSTHLKCGFRIELDYAIYLDGSILQNHYTFAKHIKKSETC